jgi:hypothetical protein
MAIDWTINAGTLLVMVGGMLGAFYGLRLIVAKLELRVTFMQETLGLRLANVENGVQGVSDILRQQAVQTEQIGNLQRQIDEMKRGEGFILPLTRGAHQVG